jgi:hypothetical protein
MFLSRKYRDRAVGLIAAYVLLIAGIVANGVLNARADSPAHAPGAAPHHCYADIVC